ncbi:ABC transporter ATP-binding protein/permease [Cyclobacteriaceae bacterium]|nr:ABC transporter ATP-binding protein/permease [Cyclobacteriaceae bacterium]
MLGTFLNKTVFHSIKRALELLPPRLKVKSISLAIGVIVNSFFDLIGIAAVLPLIAAVLKEGYIHSNKYLSEAYRFFDFSSDAYFILALSFAILTFILIKNLFALWIQKTQISYTWDAYHYLSKEILQSVYHKGFKYIKSNNSNNLQNNIVYIPQSFSQQLLLKIFSFLNELFVMVLIIGGLLVYDFKIVLLLFVVIGPFFTVFYKYSKGRVQFINEKLTRLNALASQPIFEFIFGFSDVKIGGSFNFFKSKYLGYVKEKQRLYVKNGVVQQIPNRLVEIVVIMAVLIMLVYGVFVLNSPSEIVTMLSVFGLAAYRSVPSFNRLMLSAVNIKGQDYLFDVINEFLPFDDKSQESAQVIAFQDAIKVDHISFSYENETPILDEFSLTINKGDVLGIVGKSGSGKTTLMNLLLGFLSPTKGEIKIDNTTITSRNLASWQQNIGYVSQEVFIIDANVVKNIAFGIPEENIDIEKVQQVINKAQLKSVVDQLPQGMNTNIGERGTKLSGGQRQRIGIARALYHGAKILFFDEATSSLDAQTETEITESIQSLHSEDLTMVIIAHRESTLKYCNRIVTIGDTL